MQVKTTKILENIKISNNTYLMEFKINTKIFPTQFVMVDTYPYRFLFKPFSVADFENGICRIIYRIISDGTRFLSTKKINDEIKFLGPFGNIKKFKSLKINKNHKIVLVAGGSGVASMIFLYKYFSKITNDIILFYGEKEKSYLIDLSKFGIKNILYATDNGSFGEKGSIVEVFNKNLNNLNIDYLFTCGPQKMIKAMQEILIYKNNIKSFALLEEYMCCGVGVCRSCVVKIKNEIDFIYESVCKEGPMFDLKNLIL